MFLETTTLEVGIVTLHFWRNGSGNGSQMEMEVTGSKQLRQCLESKVWKDRDVFLLMYLQSAFPGFGGIIENHAKGYFNGK